jgi:voltage-gated potassium channel
MNQGTFDQHVYRILFVFATAMLATGTVVYHLVERLGWLDAYYLSVITLTTVGYGDVTPHTPGGKLFTTFYIFAGVGILASFVSHTSRRQVWRRQQKLQRNAGN